MPHGAQASLRHQTLPKLWIHELNCALGYYVLSGLFCGHGQTRRSSILLSRPIFSTAFCTWMSPGHFTLNVFREFYFHFEHRSERRNPPRCVTSILIMQTTQINYKIMTSVEPSENWAPKAAKWSECQSIASSFEEWPHGMFHLQNAGGKEVTTPK